MLKNYNLLTLSFKIISFTLIIKLGDINEKTSNWFSS